MGTASDQLVPTPILRWYTGKWSDGKRKTTLQQWWAPNAPTFMVDPKEGEWRDIPGFAEAEDG